MDAKICIRCKFEKPKNEFGNLKKSTDGKNSYCLKCINEKNKELKINNPIRTRANTLRNHMIAKSEKLGLYFDPYFTSENIQEMIEETDDCPCGRRLDKSYDGEGKKNPATPSLDRFDSKLGYTKENVNVICARCNHLKNDAEAEELYKIAVYIAKHSHT